MDHMKIGRSDDENGQNIEKTGTSSENNHSPTSFFQRIAAVHCRQWILPGLLIGHNFNVFNG